MIRFFVFSDLHYDHVFDADERAETLINKINDSQLGFVISLGDLCYPIDENKHVISRFQNLKIPFYYCVGNHDCENYNLHNIERFFGLGNLFYSFVIEDVKFIVLNSCFMEHDREVMLYQKEKYEKNIDIYPIIPEFEMEWLKQEMLRDDMKYVILSHHSLINDFGNRGVANRKTVRGLLEKKQTILAMNGHDHGDDLRIINQIPYFTVNSASYMWHGKAKYTYTKELHKKYPYLKDIILYKDPLCCIVEIEDRNVKIYGMKSDYQTIVPEDVGIMNRQWNGISIEPRISEQEVECMLIH